MLTTADALADAISSWARLPVTVEITPGGATAPFAAATAAVAAAAAAASSTSTSCAPTSPAPAHLRPGVSRPRPLSPVSGVRGRPLAPTPASLTSVSSSPPPHPAQCGTTLQPRQMPVAAISGYRVAVAPKSPSLKRRARPNSAFPSCEPAPRPSTNEGRTQPNINVGLSCGEWCHSLGKVVRRLGSSRGGRRHLGPQRLERGRGCPSLGVAGATSLSKQERGTDAGSREVQSIDSNGVLWIGRSASDRA